MFSVLVCKIGNACIMGLLSCCIINCMKYRYYTARENKMKRSYFIMSLGFHAVKVQY